MKKAIFTAVFAFAVIIGGHQYFKNQANDNLSEIMKVNMEALADWDNNDPNQPDDDGTCFDTITSAPGLQVRYCPTCSFLPGKPSKFSGKSKCG